MLGWLLSWLLTIFTPGLLYVLCSDVLQYWQSALYVTSVCNRSLAPPLLFTHSLSTSILGDTFYISSVYFWFSCQFLFLLISNEYQNCILILEWQMLQLLYFYSWLSTQISVSLLISRYIPCSILFSFVDIYLHFLQSLGTCRVFPVQAPCWCQVLNSVSVFVIIIIIMELITLLSIYLLGSFHLS